jgi:hypothetical protein
LKGGEKMKKKLFILAMVMLMSYFVGSVAIAGGDRHDGNDQHHDNDNHSNVGEVYLYQKCPNPADDIGFCTPEQLICPFTYDLTLARVRGGWGKLKYNLQGPTFNYEFEGHGLQPGNYTLIYYPDYFATNACGSSFIYLGSDVVRAEKGNGKDHGNGDGNGNVYITGSLALSTGNSPAPENEVTYGTSARIWLVLSDDIYLLFAQFLGWTPNMYLFGEKTITFTSDFANTP